MVFLISSTLLTSPVSISMIITLNSPPGNMLLISVALRYLAVALSYYLMWDKFLCLHICLSLCVCFCVSGKSALSSVFEGNGLMKRSSCCALQLSVSCSPGPGTFRSVSIVCCIHSAVVSWLLYPPSLLPAEALIACCGKCLVPGLNVMSFN